MIYVTIANASVHSINTNSQMLQNLLKWKMNAHPKYSNCFKSGLKATKRAWYKTKMSFNYSDEFLRTAYSNMYVHNRHQ